MTELSDRNLIDAHIGGDPEAFSVLLGRHGPVVLGYLTKMTHNRNTAEDLFQETFRRVHEHAGQFRGDRLKPWVLAIASNVFMNSYRKEKRRTSVSLNQPLCGDGAHCAALTDTLVADTDKPSRLADLNEQRQRVRRKLMRLPEKQRAALILSYYHRLSHKEIAEAMGCSAGAVKTHLFRALKKLKNLLAEPANGIQ